MMGSNEPSCFVYGQKVTGKEVRNAEKVKLTTREVYFRG